MLTFLGTLRKLEIKNLCSATSASQNNHCSSPYCYHYDCDYDYDYYDDYDYDYDNYYYDYDSDSDSDCAYH